FSSFTVFAALDQLCEPVSTNALLGASSSPTRYLWCRRPLGKPSIQTSAGGFHGSLPPACPVMSHHSLDPSMLPESNTPFTRKPGTPVNFAWKAFSYASWVKVRMQKNADLVSVLMSVTMCDSVLSEGLMYCSIV